MIAVALAGIATVSGVFNCALDEVAAVGFENGEAHASMIEGLPAESLKFGLRLEGEEATIDWPKSPIQVSGKQAILPTAPNAGMVMLVSKGPCMFTQNACASMVSYAQQSDHSLSLLITPTAVSYDKEHKIRFPFLVMMRGSCHPIEASK